MTDYYTWFDPHERIASLERQRAFAYEDGRQATLNQIGRDMIDRFREHLHRAARALAEDIADEYLAPRMKTAAPSAFQNRSMRDLLIDDLMLSAAERIDHVNRQGSMNIRQHAERTFLVVEADIPPMRSRRLIDARDWR